MSEFCSIPIHIRDDMPVGCMVIMSGDGKQIIPIVNLDIEVDGILPKGPPKIEYGSREVKGNITAYFEDTELYAKFVSGMGGVARHAMEAMVKLGDQVARNGGLNRSGRKQWRKDRRRLAAFVRRADAREHRKAYGLAHF